MSGVDPWLIGLTNVLGLVFYGWLLVMVLRHLSRGEREARGKQASELRASIDAIEADRARLVQRVEALEAIVTSDGFDLEREARWAGLGEPAGVSESPRSRVRV